MSNVVNIWLGVALVITMADILFVASFFLLAFPRERENRTRRETALVFLVGVGSLLWPIVALVAIAMVLRAGYRAARDEFGPAVRGAFEAIDTALLRWGLRQLIGRADRYGGPPPVPDELAPHLEIPQDKR